MRGTRPVASLVLSLAVVLAIGTVAEGASVRSSGTHAIATTKGFDLDAAVQRSCRLKLLPSDLCYAMDEDGPSLFVPRSRVMGSARPTHAACAAAKLTNHLYWLRDGRLLGKWLCVRTDRGRLARIRILNTPTRNTHQLRFTWTTWT